MPREKDLWFGCLIYFFRKRSENINFRAFGQRNFPRKNIFFRTEFFSQKNLPYGRKLSKMFSAEQIFFPHGKCNQIAKHSKIPFWRFFSAKKYFFHTEFFSQKNLPYGRKLSKLFSAEQKFLPHGKRICSHPERLSVLSGYLRKISVFCRCARCASRRRSTVPRCVTSDRNGPRNGTYVYVRIL